MTQIQIETTQNVTVSFKAAEIEKRVLAFIIDMTIKTAYIFITAYIFNFIIYGNKSIYDFFENTDSWSVTGIIIFLILPVVLYSLVLEMLVGQTLGKKIMRIKVVKIDGYRANFIDYFIRWVFRIVDISIIPFLPGVVAFITVFNSKKTQRLGGIASGTAVIDLSNKTHISNTILKELELGYQPKFPTVIKLSDNDMRIIKETYESAIKYSNKSTLKDLKNKVMEVTKTKPLERMSDEVYMETIIRDFNYYTGKA